MHRCFQKRTYNKSGVRLHAQKCIARVPNSCLISFFKAYIFCNMRLEELTCHSLTVQVGLPLFHRLGSQCSVVVGCVCSIAGPTVQGTSTLRLLYVSTLDSAEDAFEMHGTPINSIDSTSADSLKELLLNILTRILRVHRPAPPGRCRAGDLRHVLKVRSNHKGLLEFQLGSQLASTWLCLLASVVIPTVCISWRGCLACAL